MARSWRRLAAVALLLVLHASMAESRRPPQHTRRRHRSTLEQQQSLAQDDEGGAGELHKHTKGRHVKGRAFGNGISEHTAIMHAQRHLRKRTGGEKVCEAP